MCNKRSNNVQFCQPLTRSALLCQCLLNTVANRSTTHWPCIRGMNIKLAPSALVRPNRSNVETTRNTRPVAADVETDERKCLSMVRDSTNFLFCILQISYSSNKGVSHVRYSITISVLVYYIPRDISSAGKIFRNAPRMYTYLYFFRNVTPVINLLLNRRDLFRLVSQLSAAVS